MNNDDRLPLARDKSSAPRKVVRGCGNYSTTVDLVFRRVTADPSSSTTRIGFRIASDQVPVREEK
jgi:hypothetical protein